MQDLLTDLHLARRYADEMQMGSDEGLLAQAIRLIMKVSHFNIEDIKRHYAGENVPLPQRPDVNTPLMEPMTAKVPGEPEDSIMNTFKVQGHASTTGDLPEPMRGNDAQAKQDAIEKGEPIDEGLAQSGLLNDVIADKKKDDSKPKADKKAEDKKLTGAAWLDEKDQNRADE